MAATSKELMTVEGQPELFSEQYVAFGLEDREFAADIKQLREIIRLPDRITAMPQAPPTVLGVFHLRGDVVPLICLRRVFSLPERVAGEPKVLVMEAAQGLVGLAVDTVSEVRQIPSACQEKVNFVRTAPSDRFIARVANQHGRVTLLLNLTALEQEYGQLV
jgi:purine-binding chemotaxis protein CheW